MRVVRILLRIVIVVAVLVGASAATVVAVSQTAWFRNWLRGYVVAEAGKFLNGDLSVQRLDGNLFRRVELNGIAVTVGGEPAVTVEQLGLRYNLVHLVTSGISADEIRIVRPTVYARHDARGWSLGSLIKKQEQEADRRGPRYPLSVDTIAVQGATFIIDDRAGTPGVDLPDRIENLDAEFSFAYEPVRYSLDIRRLTLHGTQPEIGVRQLTGGLAIRDDTLFLDRLALALQQSALQVDGAIEHYLTTPTLKLRIQSSHLSLAELAGVVPSVRQVDLQPSFDIAFDGPLDSLRVDGQLQSSAGGVRAKVVADLQTPSQGISGEVAIDHLDLAPIEPAWGASDITARAVVDLRSGRMSDLETLQGTISIRSPGASGAGYSIDRLDADARVSGRRVSLKAEAQAYGASMTAAGQATIPAGSDPLAYDFSGQIRAIDLRRLPRRLGAPPVATRITAGYRAFGVQPVGEAAKRSTSALDLALRFAPSTAPGVRVEEGSLATLRMRGDAISYSTDATLTGLDLREIGREFGVPALADDRYASTIDTHVVANGSGRSLDGLQLAVQGTARDSSIAGGEIPELAYTADVSGKQAHITAAGRLASFDPAVVSGRTEVRGRVGGTLDLDVTIADLDRGAALDNIEATARVALDPSKIGSLVVDRGTLDADLRDSVADLRLLEITGRELTLQANGTLALDDTGASNLRVHANSPRLEEIGRVVEQPLSGIADIEATVTGNRRLLTASGTLQGDGVKYEEHGALSLNTTFTASVPDFDWARGKVESDSVATFVTIAGQNINELTAKIQYEDRQVAFDALAKQPSRSAGAAGSLTLHPDHQEVHLDRLGLEAGNQQWMLPDGVSPTIRYAGETIELDDLRLTSGGQEIAAAGRFGTPADRLRLTMTNVDLAGVDALLLRQPQFSGRLNATADVSGSRSEPSVQGEFSVTPGGFRNFTYESFGGTASYSASLLDLDVRLQQNDTQWITAKGRLPTAVFTRSERGDDGEIAHREPTGPADSVDLVVDSSPLGLGLVQGFTTALQDVQGTVEAHLRVVGAAEDPHVTGRVTIADGAATVGLTGVTYSRIGGQVDFEPDRVHIEHIVALDNHDSALSITGNLAVHQRELTSGQLWITGHDFKVIDNKLGNLRLDSAIELTGRLSAPLLRGDLGVTTGRVDLDEVLALASTSVYSTEQTPYAAERTTDAEPQPEADEDRPLFESLQMDIRVTVPNDLVVRATDLTAPGASVGLGALNVTLGGDLRVRKETGGSARLVGSVNTVRGTYDFQGRRFQILRDGTVRFENENRIDPVLDIRTQRVIQGVEARVNVTGRMSAPRIQMTSTPPLEEADILALIIFNQPLNQLGAGDQITLAERAQGLAAGVVAGQLAQAIGSALNVDTFEINVAPDSGGGPEVTIGQQVGRNLYVKVQQGVGDDAATNVILEYELNPFLRFQSNVMQGGTTPTLFRRRQGSGADLIVLFER